MRSHASPTSRSTRSSTAARSRPASPPARAATSPRFATRGLVSQVFDEEKLRALDGDMAIGHVRYSTTGGGSWENSQPVWRDDGREVALAHNGNLTNAVELYNELTAKGISFRGTSDSEIIAALLSTEEERPIENAVAAVMPRLEGAYSTVVMTKRAVVAFRDPHGRPPAVAGQARRPLLRRLGELRVRHHRRRADARGPARRAGRDRRARDRDPPGGPRRAPGAVRVRAHLLLAPRQPPRGTGPAGGPWPDGRDPRQGGPRRGRPRDLGAGLGQPRGQRLRPRVGAPQGRRADQEPLRPADVHPARPGAAQARAADEVQPAARDRLRQARRGRRRLDRPRQHHPPDRGDAPRRRARRRSTCGSPRRRSATRATTAWTCRPPRR